MAFYTTGFRGIRIPWKTHIMGNGMCENNEVYYNDNGEPTDPFNATKWVKQDDPISPFLLATSMEYLSQKLIELKEVNAFKIHPRYARLGTHLSFADNLLLFFRSDLPSILAMYQCFT